MKKLFAKVFGRNKEKTVTEAPEGTGAEKAGETEAKKEEKAADATPSYVPGKKKVKKRWIVIGVIAVAAVAALIIRNRMAGSKAPEVEVTEVTTGSIEEIVTISGNVASAEKKSYFATVAAPIAELNVKAGDRVKKGDVLFVYSEEDLEHAKKQAELSLQQAEGTYSAAASKNAKSTDVLRGNSIHDINNRLTEITKEIDAINNKITEKKDRMSGTVTELQNTLLDINQNGVADSTDESNTWRTRTEDNKDDTDPSSSNRQMYLAVQQSLNDKQYALAHDPEIEKWEREITALNEEKSTLTEQKSVEQSKLTGGDWSQLKATKELSELTNNRTIEDIEAVAGGIRADFSGVVTSVSVTEGATVNKGAQLFSVESTDDVEVTIQISKADMTKVRVGQQVDITVNERPYEGIVKQISGSATKNTSGVPVVDARIRVKNPDDQLILGVEASNKIHTNKAEDVIVLPYEFVGADEEGDYVFVVEDGVAKRRSVTVGLTTSTDAEITEGLSVGDQVITGDLAGITDGMTVSIKADAEK
ncbi:MAG: efflux RND transporter periplasmic adaptor subunit [Lachnospiraceae bacterium]|nr:efflux RND transporter periplasmic adaptor subunit [Lachnospiraceae bacterium]